MASLHKDDSIYSRRHFPSWLLFAGAAGSVNAVAYLATERFVSHVTGTVTSVGVSGASLWFAVDLFVVFAAFVAGSAVAGWMIDARAAREKRPHYALPLYYCVGLLLVVAVFGTLGVFGPFGGDATRGQETIMLSILALAMGIQNGAVATSTGLVVRTTHVTGSATDLGLQLAQLRVPGRKQRKNARRVVALRAGKIATFVLGAGATVPLAMRLHYVALAVPSLAIVIATCLSFRTPKSARVDEAGMKRQDARTPRPEKKTPEKIDCRLATPASARP